MITKEQVKKHLETFPEEFSINDLIERLLFIEKLEKRLQESNSNEVVSEENLKTDMQKWFKSNGSNQMVQIKWLKSSRQDLKEIYDY